MNLLKILEERELQRGQLFYEALKILGDEAERFYKTYISMVKQLECFEGNLELVELSVNPAARDVLTVGVDGSSNRSERAGLSFIVVSAVSVFFKCDNPLVYAPRVIAKCIPTIGLVDEDLDRVEAISRQYLERTAAVEALLSHNCDLILLDGPILPHHDLLPPYRVVSREYEVSRAVREEYERVFRRIYGDGGIADRLTELLVERLHACVVKSPRSVELVSSSSQLPSSIGLYGRVSDVALLDPILPACSKKGGRKLVITAPRKSKLWGELAKRKVFGKNYAGFISDMRFFYFKPHDAMPIRVEVHRSVVEDERLFEYLCSALYYQASNMNNVPWPLEFAHAFSLVEDTLLDFLTDEFFARIVKMAKKEGVEANVFYRMFKPKHGLESVWGKRGRGV
ncbi:MAG: DNA double-strand break repair nuclease NurA [Candidatus Jordarchaeales archaeon]